VSVRSGPEAASSVRDSAAKAVPRTAQPAVVVDGLSKRFQGRRSLRELLGRRVERRFVHALNDVSITVPRGVMFGLLGANGAGKSTLMRILATLVLPDGGSALVEGVNVVREPRQARRLVASATGDERSLNWRLTVRQNLELYASLYGLVRQTMGAHIREVLDAVDLGEAEHRPAGQLSSGMKQRVLIARALLPNPRLLLLDEPTRSLDPVSAQGLRSFLRHEVLAKRECTVLLATHNSEEAFELCDELLILHEGRVIETGTSAAMVRRHAVHRLRLCVASFSDEQWKTLVVRGLIRALEPVTVPDSPAPCYELQLADGEDSLASLLSALVLGGARVERVEAVPLTLAGLLTRATGARVNPEA
jgi:ABC-2 type transport system ATP-binding protein